MIGIDDFKKNWAWVHRMTVDFVNVVPDDKWDFTPGRRLGPFSKQLRHVVWVRSVYNEALVAKKADFSRSGAHHTKSLAREVLVTALEAEQRRLLEQLETFDTEATIDFSGTAFTFDNFACEMIQHESIHHGQWSAYASLGGFATPQSWQAGWKL